MRNMKKYRVNNRSPTKIGRSKFYKNCSLDRRNQGSGSFRYRMPRHIRYLFIIFTVFLDKGLVHVLYPLLSELLELCVVFISIYGGSFQVQ